MSYRNTIDFTPPADDLQDPDHVYFSGQIINDSLPVASGQDPQVRFIETRDAPLVSDASKYDFTVVRFQLNGPGKDLPIWCPIIEIGPVANPTQNVNLTIYKFSIQMTVNYLIAGVFRTNTFTGTQPVIYVPETQDQRLAPTPPPSSTVTGQVIAPTRYYWIYTYSNAVAMFNTALAACIADIQTQFNTWYLAQPGAVGPAPTLGTAAPRLTYNPDNNLFTIYSDVYGFGGTSRTSIGSNADESCRLFFNAPLFGLLANFQNIYRGDVVLTNEILINNVAGLYQNALTVGAPLNKSFWLTVQDYESTSTLWCPVDSIVFISGLLPLNTEASSEPIRLGGANIGNTQTSRAYEPVITDVALDQTNAHAFRGYFQYVPQAEYRIISTLRSQTPINSFDIACYWRCRLDGKIYPLQMFSGSSASIKILLRRRGITDYPHPARYGINS
jgi:hypothetical protein